MLHPKRGSARMQVQNPMYPFVCALTDRITTIMYISLIHATEASLNNLSNSSMCGTKTLTVCSESWSA